AFCSGFRANVRFFPYFNKAFCLFIFSIHCLPETDGSLSCHSVSYYAVYSDYTPDTAIEAPVLLLFFLSAEIPGIHNRFQYPKGSFYLDRTVCPVQNPFFTQTIFIGFLTFFQKVFRQIPSLISLCS